MIICRCEGISKGEIVDTIHSPIPATTIDALKRRVRPGMGRCQGGFCSPLVTQIICEETGFPQRRSPKAGRILPNPGTHTQGRKEWYVSMKRYDVIVLGGGPAGLAAAISASKEKASVLLIEREAKMGGILKQCIHDGFGLLRFGERLTGPEYADRFLKELLQMEIDYRTSAFVLNAKKQPDGGFRLEIQTQDGILYEECSALVLACGCREKTARQVWIHGDRPAGVYTAGTAQHFVNLMAVCLRKNA